MSRSTAALIRVLVVIALPVLVVLTAARILVNTWYPVFEYSKADFPSDVFGFTQADRLALAPESIRFLNSPLPPEQAIAMLEAQRLPGTDDPLFNEYELSHMVDVKRFTDLLWKVHFAAAAVVLGGLALLLSRATSRRDGYRAILHGGLLTTGLLIFLVLAVLVSWRTFFVTFHDLFFAPGTWTFNWGDSLIRLFPDRFWFDAGTLLTVGSLLTGVVVALVGFLLNRRGS